MGTLAAYDDALIDAFRVMAAWQEEARFVEHNDAIAVVGKSRFPSPYSNVVFPRDAAQDVAELFRFAEATFADRRYVIWGRGEDGGEVGRLARARQFTSIGPVPAMVIDQPVTASSAPPIDVSRVSSESDFTEFVRVSLAAYAAAGLPERVGQSLLARAAQVLASSFTAVARIDGGVVAAALSIMHHDTHTGSVYWVGTTPSARRRGAAEAVTRLVTHACFEQGARSVILKASEAGAPLYSKIGYRTIGDFARYLSPDRG